MVDRPGQENTHLTLSLLAEGSTFTFRVFERHNFRLNVTVPIQQSGHQ